MDKTNIIDTVNFFVEGLKAKQKYISMTRYVDRYVVYYLTSNNKQIQRTFHISKGK